MDKRKQQNDSVLASGFIPTEPEEITAQWLFEVVNQYREVKDLSLLRKPEDILECEINERLTSRGYTSSTYNINIRFKCYTTMGLEESDYSFFVKMLPSSHIHYNDRGKYIAQKTAAFKREIETNFCFLRKLNAFVQNRSTPSPENSCSRMSVSAIRTPEIVYGSHDEVGNGVVVWIDETAAHGFKPTSHMRGLNLTELSCVVCRLAEYHAAATAFLIHNSAAVKNGGENVVMRDFPQIHRGVDTSSSGDNDYVDSGDVNGNGNGNGGKGSSKLVQDMTQVFRDFSRFVRRVPGHIYAFKACEQLRPSLVETMIHSTRREGQMPLKTVVHGEMWEKNVLLHRKSHFELANNQNGNGINGNATNKPSTSGGGGKRRKNVNSGDYGSSGGSNGGSPDLSLLERLDEEEDFRVPHGNLQDLPYDVMLSDWKFCSVGSPTIDLATLILTSTPTRNFREKHTKPLLQTYFKVFTNTLKERFGVDVAKKYPTFTCDDLIKDYELSLYGAFLKAASVMTVEVKNLESDFYYVKDECQEEKAKVGEDLRAFGRRFIDLIDEFVPQKLTSKAWINIQNSLKLSNNNSNNSTTQQQQQHHNNHVNNSSSKSSATAASKTGSIKTGSSSSSTFQSSTTKVKTLVDNEKMNHQTVTIKIPTV